MALSFENWLTIGFYVGVILLIIIFRKKFEFQNKIVALLKTGWGVKWMQRWGERHSRLLKFLGYVGIGFGFVGMIVIIGYLFYGLYQLMFVPEAGPVLTPVLPGVNIPGSPLTFPLFKTLIAIFIVIVVHEAAHGLVGAAHKLKIKSSGLFLFGPIPGAFVEIDEDRLVKQPHRVQHSVFAAGPWSNMLFFVLFGLLWMGLGLAASPFFVGEGVLVGGVVPGGPADMAGLHAGDVLVRSSDGEMLDNVALLDALEERAPGDRFVLGTADQSYDIVLGAKEGSPEDPWLGVSDLETVIPFRNEHPALAAVILFVHGVLFWVFVLNLGLGLANLIPLGPVDGGRMFQLVLHRAFGKKRGDDVWLKATMLVLAIVLVLVFVPILKSSYHPIMNWISSLL